MNYNFLFLQTYQAMKKGSRSTWTLTQLLLKVLYIVFRNCLGLCISDHTFVFYKHASKVHIVDTDLVGLICALCPSINEPWVLSQHLHNGLPQWPPTMASLTSLTSSIDQNLIPNKIEFAVTNSIRLRCRSYFMVFTIARSFMSQLGPFFLPLSSWSMGLVTCTTYNYTNSIQFSSRRYIMLFCAQTCSTEFQHAQLREETQGAQTANQQPLGFFSHLRWSKGKWKGR